MRIFLLIFIICFDSFANCPTSITLPENEIPDFAKTIGKNCFSEDKRGRDEAGTCACVKESVTQIENSNSYSPEVKDHLMKKKKAQPEVAMIYLANQINKLSVSLPENESIDIAGTCDLETIRNIQCSNSDPLFSPTKINEIVDKFNGTILNNYISSPSEVSKLDFVKDRFPSGCMIPDSSIMRVNHQIALSKLPLIVDLSNKLKRNPRSSEAKSFEDLFDFSDDLEEKDSINLMALLQENEASPMMSNFLKSPNVFKTIFQSLNSDGKISPKLALDQLLGNQNKTEVVTKTLQLCLNIKVRLEKNFCSSITNVNHPSLKYKSFRSIAKAHESSLNTKDSDLAQFCSYDKSDKDISFDGVISNYLSYSQIESSEDAFDSIYSNEITNSKTGAKNNLNRKRDQEKKSLTMCDYIPQPEQAYNEVGVKEAIQKNCFDQETKEETPFKHMCLQARAVDQIYGTKLAEISELEEKIRLADEDPTQIKTVEFNGEVINVVEARAKRELLTSNLFKEDMTPPRLVTEFVTGKRVEAPKVVVSTTSNQTAVKADKKETKNPVATAQSKSANKTTSRASALTSSNRNSVPNEANIPLNFVSQSQRDQNTRDLFNEVQRRIETGSKRSNKELSEISGQVQNLRSSVNNSNSQSSLSPYQSNILNQATQHIPKTYNSGSISSNDDDYAYTPTATDENGAHIFPTSNNIAAATPDKTEEQLRNEALGKTEDNEKIVAAATARATGKSGSRSPASVGGGASGGSSASPISISSGGSNSDGGLEPPTIKIDETETNDINVIDLAAESAVSAEEMIELMKASDVDSFIIQKGPFRVKVRKEKTYLVVDSLDNVKNEKFNTFLTSIRNTMNNRSVIDVISSIERTMCENPENISNERCTATTRLRDLSN